MVAVSARRIPRHPVFARPAARAALLAMAFWILLQLASPDLFPGYFGVSAAIGQASTIGILSAAALLLTRAGEFDVAVGATVTLSGVLLVALSEIIGLPLLLSSLVALLVALFIGYSHAQLTMRTGLPSLMITLGSSVLLRGLAIALSELAFRQTGFVSIEGYPSYEALRPLFAGARSIGDFRLQASLFWWLGVLLLAWWLLTQTETAKRIEASNQYRGLAANAVPWVKRTKIRLFMGTAVAAWLVANIHAFSFRSFDARFDFPLEFLVLAVLVIGGASLRGSGGSILGVFFGALILGLARASLFDVFDANWFLAFTGAVLLIAMLRSHRQGQTTATGRTVASGPALTSTSGTPGRGGAQLNLAQSETTRYLAASALLKPAFRRQIIEHVEAEKRALAPELGVDLKMLVRLSTLLEARSRFYNLIYLALTAAAAFLLICGPIVSAVVGADGSPVTLLVRAGLYIVPLLYILASGVVTFYRSYDETRRLAPLLARDSYDPERLLQALGGRLKAADLSRPLPGPDQNLVVYSGFTPFVGAGIPLGGWSFPIDTARPKDELGRQLEIKPFRLNELYDAVNAAVANCRFEGFVSRDCLFVNGKQIQDVTWILPSVSSYPNHTVGQKYIVPHIDSHDPIIRHYRWLQLYDWGNEIVVSYFLRFSRRGNQLFAEVSRYVLTALAGEHHQIDDLLSPTWRELLGSGLVCLFTGPFVALAGSFGALGHSAKTIKELNPFRKEPRHDAVKTKEDIGYDYGATRSLRQSASSPVYNHYFQFMDKEMYVKVLEKQILEALINFLDGHNIDTSDISENRTTILNSGLIVQGGDLRADALAVGVGARATVGQPARSGGVGNE